MIIQNKSLKHYLNSEEFYLEAEDMINNKASEENRLAVVSLDFDNFNFINDLFSYEVGDEALERIIAHFDSSLNDGELFSKLHADHFAFLLKAPKAANLMQRLYNMTDAKGVLKNVLPAHYNLVSSGGIVYVTQGSESLSALLDKVNYTRKQAKGSHTNTFLCYDKKIKEELEWRKAITLTMESALQGHEFMMYLQPKVLIKTGEVVGAEALVRWNSPQYGMIYPDRFIPILEQNGFIKELDFFMLEQACIFLHDSIKNAMEVLPISVNFSKIHIRTTDFVDRIFNIVSKYKIPTKLIEIEFTENIYLDEFKELVHISSSLKYLGFKVSLDDFGSAYSSLNYLKELPLDIIKIDKEFLNSSTNTGKGRIIIAKVVELIKELNLVSIMEGVETNEQVDFLQKLSCDLGQGYFYAKPMPIESYIEYVKKNKADKYGKK